MSNMSIVKFSKRGQITIPKDIRDGLAWIAGTPASVSDLSAFKKIIAGRGSATKQTKTKP